LPEFLGEDVIKDKGLCCRFVISNVPRDAPVTEPAIPLAIFQSEQSIRNHYLRKWLRLSTVDNLDILYKKSSPFQLLYKIFVNPVPRVSHPDWPTNRIINKINKKNNKKKTLKRKRDDLNDKTITRQWRIVLGSPSSFGQTTYVSYRTSVENNNNNNNAHEQLKQTQPSSGYERTINNCSKHVNRLLPRCSQAYYLDEYYLDENHFHDYYTDIMTDLSNPNIEGVYEMNVPLDFRLLVTLDCICSLRKEQYRTNMLSNLYQYDELEFLSLSDQTD
ncbi:unnamed protein product, partial [Rotaria sp. Silwood1]